jgi:hypothetical protein
MPIINILTLVIVTAFSKAIPQSNGHSEGTKLACENFPANTRLPFVCLCDLIGEERVLKIGGNECAFEKVKQGRRSI